MTLYSAASGDAAASYTAADGMLFINDFLKIKCDENFIK